ncbi:MAG: sporulation protein YqfD [Clostridia bacterium]|nr:sporulation protein YqfD [Clostridia bacterium]
MSLLPRVRVSIEGVMPERALLRLKRAGICLYNIKKPQKNRIVFSIKKKDSEKVFAIYPNVCYNRNGYSPYTARRIGALGFARVSERLGKRLGLLLGGLLFCAATLFADSLVLGVDFVGSSVYAREAYAALEEQGIKPFSRYASGKEDLVCAKLLALERVEFCSVKKSGLRVQVEIRLADFEKPVLRSGDMLARHTGKLLSVTALRGTPLKKLGDSVTAGEALVGGYVQAASGERVAVQPIARASIACTYETELAAGDEEEAFAESYLALDLREGDRITARFVERRENAYFVRIEYIAIEAFNL